MGGTLSVVIRDDEGQVHKLAAWTNPTPYFIHDMRFVEKDKAYLEAYIKREDGGGLLAPLDYGLLLVDYQTSAIYHCQDYSNYAAHFVSSSYPKDEKELAYSLENDRAFAELFDAGRLKNIVVTTRGAHEEKKPVGREDFKDGNDFLMSVQTVYQWADFDVDLSPWTVKRFEDNRRGWEAFRDVCRNLIGLSNDDESEWADWLENLG